jgi:tRNA 2-thiouridine synthesizing protein C
MPDRRSLLLIIRHSPYGGSLARASIDTVLAAAAFDQKICVLFSGDGVLQLVPDQASESLGTRSMGRLLSSLPLYDVAEVYVDAEAARRYQLDLKLAPVPAVALARAALQQLVRTHDHVLGF